MGLSVNTIITLENQEKFIVLNESFYEGFKYFMVMGINDNKEIIPTKAIILKEIVEGIDTYVSKVTNSDLMTKLTEIFKDQM